VGVPAHIVYRDGKRIVITDPKQIADPLSEALAVVATQVKELKDKVKKLEGNGNVDHDGVHSLQAVIEIDYQI
jgi:serine O-acetyltransferase